jgi:hypothetical protein
MTKQHTARLAARLTARVDTRLRQLALLPRRRISPFLHDTPDSALPTAHDLTAQVARLSKRTRGRRP